MKCVDNQRPIECTQLWKTFFERYKIVCNGTEDSKDREILEDWNNLSIQWIRSFMKLHDLNRLRIYEHILLFHGKDLYIKHGPLRWLSKQVCIIFKHLIL